MQSVSPISTPSAIAIPTEIPFSEAASTSPLANYQIINDTVSPLLIQVEKVLEKISALNNLSSIIKTKSKLI